MKALTFDVVCLSHLRWSFVFQRPQHLMRRFAKDHRVFFWEEPVREAGVTAHVRFEPCSVANVRVCVPVLPLEADAREANRLQELLLRDLLEEQRVSEYLLWYYTPMAYEFSADLKPAVTVFDCMDELSGFAGAPASLRENEASVFARADLVFTGGASLFESKQGKHNSVFLFPSSVDAAHFGRARKSQDDPGDQSNIPRPRLGYAGVIDERMDLELIRQVARARPEWQLVLLGPVVKIDPASLPQAANIHYLGMKPYEQLPRYLSSWQIGMLPFASNDATRFISPTKTPEYLAAGLRVVSTPIRDVVVSYGELGLAGIASSPEEFVAVVEEYLAQGVSESFREKADAFLKRNSWDSVWSRMNELVEQVMEKKSASVSKMGQGSKDLAHV